MRLVLHPKKTTVPVRGISPLCMATSTFTWPPFVPEAGVRVIQASSVWACHRDEVFTERLLLPGI